MEEAGALMGYYRLFLAYAVAYSHIEGKVYGINPGIVAVISFLLLSGYVITALIHKYYVGGGAIISFYIDRFLRIAPQFYFYGVVTLLGASLFGLHHEWMAHPPTATSAVAQLLIVPSNFYRYFPDMLLPQSWSLALEVTFYAALPIILLSRSRVVVAGASFCLFGVAYCGLIDTDMFGYRLLPGTLFIFLIGSFISNHSSATDRYQPGLYFVLSVILLTMTFIFPGYKIPYNQDVLYGLVIGIVAVYTLSKFEINLKSNQLCGDISYGIFLNHFFVAGLYYRLFTDNVAVIPPSLPVFFCLCAVSTLMSYLSFLSIERPFIRWRRPLRGPALQKRIAQRLGVSGLPHRCYGLAFANKPSRRPRGSI